MAVVKLDKIASGSVSVTASQAVSPGIGNLTSVTITRQGSSSPGVKSAVYTAVISGASFTIYAWMPTSNANPTLIAGDTAATVNWIATA